MTGPKGRRFFIWVGNDEHGPFREALVLDRYLQGRLPQQAFVWTYGLDRWVTAQEMFGDQVGSTSPLPPGSEISGITRLERAIDSHDPAVATEAPRTLPLSDPGRGNVPQTAAARALAGTSTEHKILIGGGLALLAFLVFLLTKFL